MATTIWALWTAPRCMGTAFELMAEARGDLHIEVNVFDSAYYFVDGAGKDRPAERPGDADLSFRAQLDRLLERVSGRPTFIRCAAYTVQRHLEQADWSAFHHTILIRDPRYSLPSHRQRVDELTLEEAGYTAQVAILRHLLLHGIRPVVIDAHDLLAQPERMIATWCAQAGLPHKPDALRWPSGHRPRWHMWSHWKEDAARSEGFAALRTDPQRERQGESDPLYPVCRAAYEELYAHRLHAAGTPNPVR